MQTFSFLAFALLASVTVLRSAPACAAGTSPGTVIENSVTVNYESGLIAQTAITVSDSFKVDRKIIFTVTEATPTGTAAVTPGQNAQVARFQLTNASNDTLDFALTAIQQATIVNTAHGGQDGFDLTAFAVFVDANGNGIYEPATDTATAIDNLADDQSLIIFIVGDVPLTATNGQIAGVELTAIALESTGGALIGAYDTTPNNPNTVETVFADSLKTGIGGASAARDRVDVATDSFTVAAPVLSVVKTSKVISDAISATNPKSLPGALIEYCISVTNADEGATPNNIIISDIIPATMTYEAGTILTNATVTAPGPNQICTQGTEKTDSDIDADGGRYTAASATVVGLLNGIVSGVSKALIFRAKIN